MKSNKLKSMALSLALVLTMLIGMVPGMSLTAHADNTETPLTTITGTGTNGVATSENISYSTGGVATLTFSGDVLYASVFGWWGYNITLTVTPADGYTITKCVFYDNKDNKATDSEAPFVAETSGDQKMPKVNGSYIYPYSDSAGVKKIEVYGYAHTHDFTYSASGATITAACSADGCSLTDKKATLTLVNPTLTTYGETGKSAEATLTGLTDFNTATGKNVKATDIRYVGRDGTTYAESATAPTNAGKYTARITVEGKTASVEYEIAKAAGSISYTTASVNKAYGDAAFTNELTKTGDGTVSYASDKTSVATVNSETGEVNIVGIGEANITATVADGDNSTYTTKTASYTLTVSAKPMTVSAEGYTGAYDGNPHSITVNVTEPTSGTTIAYGTTEGTYDLTANPESTNVSDSKTIYFKVTAPNYADYTGSAAVTISKADQDAPAAPEKSSATINSITLKTVDGCEYKKGADGTWQDSPTFNGLTMNTEYSFYQRLKGDDNHNPSPDSDGANISTSNHTHNWSYQANGATITATCVNTDGGHTGAPTSTLTIKAPALTTYGGEGSADATIEGSIDGVTNPPIEYKKGSEALASAPTAAGTYTANITLDEATASVEYTIAQKPVTVSGITAGNKEYDGTTDAELDCSKAAFAGKLDTDTLSVTATGTFADANVGTGKTVSISGLTLGGTDKANYVLAAEGQQTTDQADIAQKSITGATVTLDKTQLTYNGQEQSVSVTGVTTSDGMTLSANDYEVASGTNKGTNKGDYQVTVTGKGNFKDTAAADWKIVEKAMTVKADNVTVTYDGKEHGINVEVIDPASGAEVKYGTKEGTYDLDKSPTIKDPGTLTVYYKVTDGPNYSVYTGKAVVTVEKPAPAPTSKPVLAAKGISKGKKSLKLTWNKVDKAASYEVWMAKCGKKMKKVKTLGASKTSWTKKKLKRRTAYKFYVVAKDSSGNVISRSLTGHAITGNVRGRYTNAKSLSVSQSSINLNKGGTAKISATQKKAKKGKKLCKHAALLRYTSNNPAVATVDSNGNIKTVDAGSCTVYVQTVNGIWKTVTVNVN